MRFRALEGKSYPLGATVMDSGVNFAIYSKRANYLELLLFDSELDPSPSSVYRLEPEKNRTTNYWHIFLEGCRANQVYAWRAGGPYYPEQGMFFDSEKLLLDPYARGIAGWEIYNRQAAIDKGDNCAQALRSVVIDCRAYDWGDDHPPKIPYASTIIYELHVGGFTKRDNSCVSPQLRGTYAGLIEKIPYLKELGVTTIELMPVQSFDPSDAPFGLCNYWGYSPIGFFTPHAGYSSIKSALGTINEFRDMVKACHANKLEVILDVVFNHTTENDEKGPTLSFKGLDCLTYYTVEENRARFKNFSGCGNALRVEHPVVGHLILDALRFWVEDMHVDGFRFDLASVLSRDLYGSPAERPPSLWAIESDHVLASAKLIAEAWDSAGLYQVGWFVTRGNRFAEWNGPFRDDVRRFVKGGDDSVGRLANRLLGSQDIYGHPQVDPNRSINFLTCHDGFTLNDVVSYNQKHNEANGENNADGNNENFSWNCGVEGETDDPAINRLRLRQIKNMLAILFLSRGTPMLYMGDEARRTTGGNNNPYCQDNEINWFDWDLVSKNHDLVTYTKRLIKFSKAFADHRRNFVLAKKGKGEATMQKLLLSWHGVRTGEPDFCADSHSLAMEIGSPSSDKHLYAVFNSYWQPLDFEVPATRQGDRWHKVLDTALDTMSMMPELCDAPSVQRNRVTVQPRSTVVLVDSNTLSICSNFTMEDSDQALSETLYHNVHRDRRITWTTMNKPVIPSEQT